MKKLNVLAILFIFLVGAFSFFVQSYTFSNPSISYYSFDSSSSINQDYSCDNINDFHLQVAPTGCLPTIVRSDLLEEQNVAVFCPISATKVNPAVSVESIRSMTFSGNHPSMVSGVGFYPANAGLSNDQNSLSNFPVLENIGYAVIVLKKTENESAMPKFVEGNLSARISYDTQKAFGIGDVDFYLPELTDYEWKQDYANYGFWSGKGFLRAENVDSEGARISVYSDESKRISSFDLKKGESSSKVYLPGFYCSAGFKVQLSNLINPTTTATIKVDDDVYNLAVGDRFLENRCQVRKIERKGIYQEVSIYCSRDDKKQSTFTLIVSPKVNLSGSFSESNFSLGGKIGNKDNKDFYLVYLDSLSGNAKINSSDLVVWVASENKDDSKSFLSSVELENYANKVKRYVSNKNFYLNQGSFKEDSAKLYFIKYDQDAKTDLSIKNNGFFIPDVSSFESVSRGEYFNNALENYLNLTELYPTVMEKDSFDSDLSSKTYSEKGLISGIELSNKLRDSTARKFLISKLLELYPTSENREYARFIDIESFSSSYDSVSELVSVNSEYHSISLENVQEPTFENYGILLTIFDSNGKIIEHQVPLTKNFIYGFDGSSSVSLVDLSMEKASISFSYNDSERIVSNRISLESGILGEGGKYKFRLEEINLVPVARVIITPQIDNQHGFSNISYKIGIEKRAIDLAPDKIDEKIADLNESIKKWEDISENLGNVVSGLKGACLATGAILTVKNFFSGLSGEVNARNYAMRGIDGESGIYAECNSLIAAGKYRNLQECLSKDEIKSKIEKSTKAYQEILEEQQDSLTEIREKSLIEDSGFGLEKVVDDKKYLIEYSKQLSSKLGSGLINEAAAENGNYLISDLRTLDFCFELKKKDPSLWESACKSNVEEITKSIEEASKNSAVLTDKENGARFSVQDVLEVRNQVTLPYRGLKIKSSDLVPTGFPDEVTENASDEVNIATIVYLGKPYIVFLTDLEKGNFYYVKKAYEYTEEGGKIRLGLENTSEIQRRVSKFVIADSYDNEVSECVVRYFGSDPDKGRPAVVPFISTKGKGWYVGVRHATVSLGSSSNYDKSGAISSYYICNAGDDGKINFNPDAGAFSGGDYCTSFSISGGTVAETEAFGLTKSEISTLVKRAVQAVKDAGIYSPGKKTVSVTGRSCRVGDAAADLIQTQCQDFMSPTDCEILFNVCDPVVCPSSRCNLGGTYPVADVIQSGIIGSLVLCFPNFKLLGGDVYFPICLSGLKAGLDSYLSILKSYRSCLEEKANTGKMIGICDQMYSIYLCEFFWSQASSFTDLIVPRLLQFVSGGMVRGGGEYMNVQQSWDNAQSSVSYFTSQYAQGSFDILDGSTVSSLVQTEFCQRFASASVPSWTDLVEPTSPSQFHGSFEEISFNSAVVPPVSQYSVFYHIYAGTEDGVYYRVYLKNPSGTTVYASNPTIVVDSGYISSGEYVSEKKDFTTSSGYKEMCISVGDQEECGFGSVSTSFALNYVSDSLAAKSASATNVTTESQCVSGTRNAYALLNTNLQAGVKDYINPDISSQGIVRVCSSNNPGATTEPSRWSAVGYCNDPSIFCWLDEKSVKEAIKTTSLEEATLNNVNAYGADLLLNDSYYSSEEFNKIVKEFGKAIDSKLDLSNKIQEIKNVLDNSQGKILIYDYQRANLLFLIGSAYSVLAMQERGTDSERSVTIVNADSEKTSGEGNSAKEGKEASENEKTFKDLFKVYDSSEKEISFGSNFSFDSFPIYLENSFYSSISSVFLNLYLNSEILQTIKIENTFSKKDSSSIPGPYLDLLSSPIYKNSRISKFNVVVGFVDSENKLVNVTSSNYSVSS